MINELNRTFTEVAVMHICEVDIEDGYLLILKEKELHAE